MFLWSNTACVIGRVDEIILNMHTLQLQNLALDSMPIEIIDSMHKSFIFLTIKEDKIVWSSIGPS